ncbi:hypothetical protein OQL12_002497 [Clostridium perfringens]|uniref:hypothetical protein n=1 Tax=Clostridium TaxID=1485 RepID=UPI00016BD571|nr:MULTISPECIES: hypothetical protein [Clostridium]EDT27329.1 conserved hypothetical protein [Clostridium perfringens CPE str. F4969]EGT0681553.1 hypothetical protein [Clostridium perfringens]MDH5070705.1 hypothetical protein [Clostridium perfringens]MDH5090476.1 hypothetical protein [Clostridium perfringens]MDM0722431.1 hypothetical protein [Clostridium perfringens]
MDIKGFTKADNSILFNTNLSNNAKLIYLQIKYYSSIPNFKLSKFVILKDSGLSVNTFNKVIKELKEAGLVKQVTERNGKSNIYWYTLAEFKVEKEKIEIKNKKKINTKKSNSDDNNEVLEGQLHIDDVIGSNYAEKIENKENMIDLEKKEDNEEVRLMKTTGEPMDRVIHAIKYALKRQAKDLYSYALRSIQNDWDNYYSKKKVQKNYQNKKNIREANFTQREYDFNSLESKLLGWDNEIVVKVPELPSCVGCNKEKIENFEDRKEYVTLDELFGFGA